MFRLAHLSDLHFGRTDARPYRRRKAPIAIAALLGAVATAALGLLPIAAAAIVGVAVSVALVAQTKINPTDPQPTCPMCPGYYIPASEIEAYTKKAIAERRRAS